ncbi:MAG: hypothetical protein ACXVRK_07075 [Gaiellaceae bacterium]
MEPYLADPNVLVGVNASTLEVLMVEIRVAVTDAAGAYGLMRRLGRLFGRSSLSFDAMRSEVQVRSEWGSRSVVEVIDAVQSWLAADCIGSATLSVGDRSYTMAGPVEDYSMPAQIDGATALVLR